MIDREEYGYFIKELLKRKTQPYHMSNEPLARELYERFKLEYPAASIHFYDISQYICMDNRARRKLAKLLKAQQKRQTQALQNTIDLINEVESEVLKHDNCSM